MLSESLSDQINQTISSFKEPNDSASEHAIRLYQTFLDLLLLYPNQPLTPNQTIDTIFHQQIALTQSPQKHLPFTDGYLHHQRVEDAELNQKNFLETAKKLERFGSEIVKAFLSDSSGACDILYRPNSAI
jgi:hypothetical protein